MQPSEYYEVVTNTLHIISETINHPVDALAYRGRSGSKDFEELEVKSYIRTHHDEIITTVNDSLREGLILNQVVATENIGESEDRTMEDISSILQKLSMKSHTPLPFLLTSNSSKDILLIMSEVGSV